MRYETNGVIDGMRERYIAVAVEIADALKVLAEANAGAPRRAREAAFAAIAQIAAVQERLSRATQHLPPSRAEQLALMQSVLQAQHGALVQLALIVKQLGVPHPGRAGRLRPPPAESFRRLAPPARHASSELGRAVSVSHRFEDDEFDVPSRRAPRAWQRPRPRPRPRQARRAARRPRSTIRRITVLFKAVTSRSLILVTFIAAGLLVAYGRFPRASDQPPPRRHIEVPRGTTTARPATIPEQSARPGGPPSRPSLPPQVAADPLASETSSPPPLPVAQADPRMAGQTMPGIVVSSLPLQWPRDNPPPPPRDEAIGAAPRQQEMPAKITTAALDPAAPGSERGFVPVLFTHREQTTAKRAFLELQSRFPNVLQRRKSELQTVNMGEKGVWHRVIVVPPGPREQADSICRGLMVGGYDRCWVKDY